MKKIQVFLTVEIRINYIKIRSANKKFLVPNLNVTTRNSFIHCQI